MNEMDDSNPQGRDPSPHLSDSEKRNVVEHFIEEGSQVTIGEVEAALEAALKKIAPSENREELVEAMEEILGDHG